MATKKSNKSKGTRKSTMVQKRKKNTKKSQGVNVPKKIVITLFLLVSMAWATGWFVLSDAPARLSEAVSNKTLDITAKSGFKVENILVEGRKYSDVDALMAVINVGKGDPILSFNPVEAKEQIERIGWVKSAHVERRLPDTIYIRLVERTPIALWRHDAALSLVDNQGNIITNESLASFKDLPMVIGRNAPEKTMKLMASLDKVPELSKELDYAELIDDRRWNLFLRDKKLIKLPEKNHEEALEHIMQRHKEDKILSKKAITEIDARYKGRLIVQTKLGTVQDYKSNIHAIGTNL